jgi:ATP-binding cassette, subfamily B, bacterial
VGPAVAQLADEAELASAVRLAVLDRDVGELEDGLGTVVGPRGVKLSGGQVQRTGAQRGDTAPPA